MLIAKKRSLPCRLLLLAAAAWFGAGLGDSLPAAEPDSFPHFQEVLRLLRANLEGVTEEELNRALVEGLLDHFHPRVLLVTNTLAPPAPTNHVLQRQIYEPAFAYLRLGSVGAGLAAQLDAALDSLRATNTLRGLILDLRYTDGEDYRAAAEAADRFTSLERPLLRWQDTQIRSTAKTNAISLPTAVLVNPETRGAPEALAAILREIGPSVAVGRTTPGLAAAAVTFPLGENRELRIASATLTVGDRLMLTNGVVPDITVDVSDEDERAYYEGKTPPTPAPAAAARTAVPRVNEAELMRRRRGNSTEGTSGEALPTPPSASAPAVPAVADPALARAIDLLKAVALLGHAPR